MSDIRWPPRFRPGIAPVHVRNELTVAAPPAAVWAKLIRATGWPDYYANASRVRLDGGGDDLSAGATFRWRTFGVDLVTTVEAFDAPTRIAWLARGVGVEAYHAWLLAPAGTGTHVVTEETQYGALARLGALVMPRRMHDWHQKWLEGLARAAIPSPPPATRVPSPAAAARATG